jgi:hypothetical protein
LFPPEAALAHFEDALQYATELRVAPAVAAFTSDIARLSKDPTDFSNRVNRLLYWIAGGLAPWLESISSALSAASALASVDLESALFELRAQSGGNRDFPLSAAMASRA